MSQGKSLAALFFLAISSPLVRAQTPAQVELFEKDARPILVGKCQSCHNAKLKSGGFDLSSPEGMKEAAASGIFGIAAEPEKSPILQALSYENRVKMPPQGKLPTETIAAIREWVAHAAENRMPIHDFHATVLALLGLDHTKLTYPYSGRNFRLAETAGIVHDGILR